MLNKRRERTVKRKFILHATAVRVWDELTHERAAFWLVDNCAVTLPIPNDLVPAASSLRVFAKRSSRKALPRYGVVTLSEGEPLRHLRIVEHRADPHAGFSFNFSLAPHGDSTRVEIAATQSSYAYEWAFARQAADAHLRNIERRLGLALQGDLPRGNDYDGAFRVNDFFRFEIDGAIEVAAPADVVWRLIEERDLGSDSPRERYCWQHFDGDTEVQASLRREPGQEQFRFSAARITRQSDYHAQAAFQGVTEEWALTHHAGGCLARLRLRYAKDHHVPPQKTVDDVLRRLKRLAESG